MSAYYQFIRDEQVDNSVIAYYQSTEHAQGAWNPHEQHMAPATGIICAELERFMPRPEMRIARISLDILGLIPAGDFSIVTKLIRPGKTIELIESQMIAQGKACIVARVWRILKQDSTAIQGFEDVPQQRANSTVVGNGLHTWSGGYIKSLQAQIEPDVYRPGKGLVWLNTDTEMVEHKATSDFVHLMGLVDTANGVVARLDLSGGWAFPNLDLQIHLLRMPQGRWLGLETKQQFGDDGIGLTSAILHDDQGAFAHSEQILTLRKLPTT